jgi:DNA-binding PadR family transcriptional regulator
MVTTREVRHPGVREVIPRTEWPNFRDHAMSVEGPLVRLLQNLSRRFGRAYPAESGLRKMICEDTAHMPGVGTIPVALERLERRGIIAQRWALAGTIRPDDSPTGKGARLIVVARDGYERERFRELARTRDRRRGVVNIERKTQEALALVQQIVKRAALPKAELTRDTDPKRVARRKRGSPSSAPTSSARPTSPPTSAGVKRDPSRDPERIARRALVRRATGPFPCVPGGAKHPRIGALARPNPNAVQCALTRLLNERTPARGGPSLRAGDRFCTNSA